MADLNTAWTNGMLQVIQGVGYPNQNRSHFRSQDIWMSASNADQYLDTGWLGRYFDDLFPGYPNGFPNQECPDPIAISIGTNISETCQGTNGNYGLAVLDPSNLTALNDPNKDPVPNNCYGMELSFLRDAIKQTNAYSDRIEEAAQKGKNLSTKYGATNTLAQHLKIVAKLISGGLKSKVYVVNMMGYDTHGGQVNSNDTSTGTHANLLGQLSNAICAFLEDCVKLGIDKRVIGMTFSEFGRRIKTTGSGTEHGSAAPMFLFGSCINPVILGNNPVIPTNVGDLEGVTMQYDFRSVYGSILNQWFNVDKAKVQSLIFDQYQDLPIILGCNTTATYDQKSNERFSIQLRNNIITDKIELIIKGKATGRINLSLLNEMSYQIKTQNLHHDNLGETRVVINAEDLTNGIYFLRVADLHYQSIERIVKFN
jgi:uncharacterized protein (DUF1501 family)